jgi:signal transduction histidine kinase
MPVMSVPLPTQEENMEMAQFLHDHISSNLAVLKMQLCHTYKHTKNRSQRRELKSMSELVDQIIASIREASSGICERAGERSLYAAIGDCARRFERHTSIPTFFHSLGTDEHISGKISGAVVAILREALANVVRHARATEVQIDAVRQRGFLTLSVRDNGNGISESRVKNGDGFGLFSIRQRASDCGGTVCIRSQPGRGFEVVVRIPLVDTNELDNRESSPAAVRIEQPNVSAREGTPLLTTQILELAETTGRSEATVSGLSTTPRRRGRCRAA